MHGYITAPSARNHRRDKPKHKRPPLEVRIVVYDIATDKQIREHKTDFSNPERRKWLSDLIIWAACNGKSVEVFNVKDDAH